MSVFTVNICVALVAIVIFESVTEGEIISQRANECYCTRPPPCLILDGQSITFPDNKRYAEPVNNTEPVISVIISCPIVESSLSNYHSVCIDGSCTNKTTVKNTDETPTCSARAGDDSVELFTCSDREPPLIRCPANITRYTLVTELQTTQVNFTAPNATDNSGYTESVTCTHAGGSQFPIGQTEVTCSTADASRNNASCSFFVDVKDRWPPLIQCPANITRYAEVTELQTTQVNFTAPNATDNSGYTEPVTCTPTGGSQFPIGQTEVTCSTADASRNNASCTIFVDVKAGTTTPENPTVTMTSDESTTGRSTTTICNRSDGCNGNGIGNLVSRGSQCQYCSLLILPFGAIFVLVLVRVCYIKRLKRLKREKNTTIGNGKVQRDPDKDPEAITKTSNGPSKMANGKQTSTNDETPKRTSNIHSNEAFEENEEVKNTNSEEQKKDFAKDEKDTDKTQKTDNKSGSTANDDSSTKSVSGGVGLAKIGKLPSESNC